MVNQQGIEVNTDKIQAFIKTPSTIKPKEI